MKKLVFAALTTAGITAVGCTTQAGDPVITANISIHNGGGAGPVVCQQDPNGVGTDFVRVNARLTGTQSGFSDVYDCNTTALRTPPLTAGFGPYDLWVDYGSDRGFPNDTSKWVIVDSTDFQTVDVQDDVLLDADLTINNGFFEANWTINGTDPTCPANAASGSITATLQSDNSIHNDLYNCEDGLNNPNPVITDPNPIGDYVVVLELLDSNNQSIGSSGAGDNASINNGNEYNDLGVIDITTF